MKRGKARGLALAAAFILAGCGQGSSSNSSPKFDQYVTIVLNTPATRLPYVSDFTAQGAQLAVDQVNAGGGVKIGDKSYGIKLEKLDNQLSPATSLANIQRAVSEKAVAVIDDGYTVGATFQAANSAGLPILVDYNTDASVIDPATRPNVFRVAPPDDALAMKLVPYIATRNLKVAVAHDDSDYGKSGDEQVTKAMTAKSMTPTVDVVLPSTSTDFSAQALQVKQSGATGVVVWARGPVLASFVKALGDAGSTAAIFSGPTAEDPVVRTQLAARPEWVNMITYASFRITTETGPESWNKFRKAYEDHNFNNGGPDYKVGVKSPADHKDIVQPPDWQMFPYDMVHLVKAALEKAGTTDTTSGKLIDALNNVQVKSANGDNRGWKKDNHEGVVDDDIYFATFQDMKFKPVQDDALSKSLPPIDQE
jgi:branched-chain amino acid transport system substrate-binding protein